MKCPQCSNYMKFNMEYSCGYPQIYYTCTCGYDSRVGLQTIWSTSSTPTTDFTEYFKQSIIPCTTPIVPLTPCNY